MGLTRTNWRRGIAGVTDVGMKVTRQVGAIIGSEADTMVVSAGGNMREIAAGGWAGFTCSIKFLAFRNVMSAAMDPAEPNIYQVSYTQSTDTFAGMYVNHVSEGSVITDTVGDTESITFSWRAVIVSI